MKIKDLTNQNNTLIEYKSFCLKLKYLIVTVLHDF